MDASSVVDAVETAEAAGVDLTAVLELLGQTNQWLEILFCLGVVLVGAVIGLGAALVIEKVLR